MKQAFKRILLTIAAVALCAVLLFLIVLLRGKSQYALFYYCGGAVFVFAVGSWLRWRCRVRWWEMFTAVLLFFTVLIVGAWISIGEIEPFYASVILKLGGYASIPGFLGFLIASVLRLFFPPKKHNHSSGVEDTTVPMKSGIVQ